ncbi:WD40 repeat protein [Saccharothrix carnea]|uniref:WD40 repeat protein n=1 Tax=Saccharothrix carnea TaxID=1280637 RepID=A0A2P8I7Y6_SACCR|nr:trypsin-like peptidase domain-containing protein [Saccharothrix carnea]PSL54585.1 WD40 repeat protein [Saccharothrix carnea]
MPDGSLPTSVVRFTDTAGRTVGAGVVVGRHVVTCAHVVNLALGLDPHSTDRPSKAVEVDFPATSHEPVPAHVRTWAPPPPREGSPGDDVATLELDLPAGVTPARLVDAPLPVDSPVDVFGYPENRPDGSWARAVVRGRVGPQLLQLDSESALAVQRGYSGSPVWDRRTGRVAGIIATAHLISDIAYAYDGRRIATLEADGTVCVWDAHTGDLVTVLPHRVVGRIWFVEPGNRLVARDSAGSVQFWDIDSGAVVKAMPGVYHDLVVSSDGSTLATRRLNRVEIWWAGNVVMALATRGDHGVRMALSPAGSTAAIFDEGAVTVANVGSGRGATFQTRPPWVEALHLVDETRMVLSDGFELDVVDTEFKPIAQLARNALGIASAADGTFAVVSTGGSAALHTKDGKPVRNLSPGAWSSVGSASYSPDGRSLLTTCDDGAVRVWDLMTGTAHVEVDGHSTVGRFATFSPVDRTIAIATRTGFGIIGPDGTTLDRATEVQSLAISHDGAYLLTLAWDELVTFWDTRPGRASASTAPSGPRPVCSPSPRAARSPPRTSTAQSPCTPRRPRCSSKAMPCLCGPWRRPARAITSPPRPPMARRASGTSTDSSWWR